MKIDQQYLKDLLLAFENWEKPSITAYQLSESGGFELKSIDFAFHMRLLDDQRLIARTDGHAGIGLYIDYDDEGNEQYDWPSFDLRLTSRGHDFIADLRQKEVWETIKTNFKDEGISTLMGLSKSLALGFAKKRVKELTGLDIE